MPDFNHEGFGSDEEVYRRMWGDPIEPITWTCHICGDRRPDQFIGVYTQDLSSRLNLKPGMVTQNVRYCLDRQGCVLRREHFLLIPIPPKAAEGDRA